MSVVSYTISSNGSDMPISYEVLSISVVNEVNRIAYAELVLIDGDYATQQYEISDGSFFNPGKTIKISLRFEGKPDHVVFEGMVTGQSLRHDQGSSLLTVDMSDAAIKLTAIKQTRVYEDITDSDLIKALIAAGLTFTAEGTIDDTDVIHERIIQYQTSNWDMLLSRADVSGLYITNVNGKVSAQKLPALTNTVMKDFNMANFAIYDVDMSMDSREQFATVETASWDEQNHKILKSKADDFSIAQGELKDDEKLRKTLTGTKGEQLLVPVALSATEAKNLADARLKRTRLAMVRGSIKIDGYTDIELLELVHLTGMGNKFDGKTIITGIRHEIVGGNWFTHLQFGLSSKWLSVTDTLTALPASGLLPGINGLQIAIVESYELDPTASVRVKVRLPGVTDEDTVIWARLTSIDAGPNRGMLFWPEKGDEVILGFINDDPRFPVILGSVYGAKHKPAIALNEENTTKGFVSKTGMSLMFDDEQQQISIMTSAGSRVIVNEKEKFIEINDVNNNNITLNADGVNIDTKGSLVINAVGNIDIKGAAVTIAGNTIELK